MPGPSPERMAELAFQHEQYEFDADVEAILSTLVPEPVFYFFPHGVRVEGQGAVRAMYEGLCAHLLPKLNTSDPNAKREMTAFATNDSQLLAEVEQGFTFPDGQVRRVRMYAVVGFDGELITGETTYMDQALADYIGERVFDEAFLALPGVTRL